MRRLIILLTGALLVIACGSDAIAESSTSTSAAVEEQAATATTVVESTTTEPVGPVVVVPGRTVSLEAGTVYRWDRFLVPVRPVERGWRALSVQDTLVHLVWLGSDGEKVSLTFAAHRPRESVEAVTESIVEDFGLDALSEAAESVVAGRPGLSVDVEAPEISVAQDSRDCDSETGRVLEMNGEFTFGFGACSLSRVWVVDAVGSSVTVIGSTFAVDRFDDRIAVVERLLASMTFESS